MSEAIKLKDENLVFYEVDTVSNDDTVVLSDEDNAANEEFMKEHVEAAIIRLMSICPCRMPEVMERHTRRCQLLDVDPRTVAPELQQEDLDAYKFGVVVLSRNGVYYDISAVVRECNKCHKLDFWGDSAVISRLLAEVTTNYYSRLEEVSMTAPVDTVESIFGEGAYLETIEEIPEAEEVVAEEAPVCEACCEDGKTTADTDCAACEGHCQD